MDVSRVSSVTAASGMSAASAVRDLTAAVSVLWDRGDRADVGKQLQAYTALADRWRGAQEPERAVLARALTESPFGQRVHATLNSYTRAAWAGTDAAPPAPQQQSLAAFDRLSDEGQQIVSAMQTDPSTGARFASAADYRARLQADVEAATPVSRGADKVTLSDAARAVLAGGAAPEAATPTVEVRPDLGAAFNAYAKAAG